MRPPTECPSCKKVYYYVPAEARLFPTCYTWNCECNLTLFVPVNKSAVLLGAEAEHLALVLKDLVEPPEED